MSKRHKNKPPTPEERERMVRDAMRHLVPLIGHDKKDSDIDEIIKRAKSVISKVDSHFNSIDKAVKDKGEDHNRQFLREEGQRMYLNEFHTFNKEELLLILVCFFTDRSISQVV